MLEPRKGGATFAQVTQQFFKFVHRVRDVCVVCFFFTVFE